MKILAAITTLTFGATGAVHADGIPWNRVKGTLTEPAIRMMLSERQMTCYHTTGSFEFTQTQLRRLRVKCAGFPNQPSKVVSYRYSDCTCCIGHPYAIMLPGGYEVAVPLSELESVNRYGASPERPVVWPTTRKTSWISSLMHKSIGN